MLDKCLKLMTILLKKNYECIVEEMSFLTLLTRRKRLVTINVAGFLLNLIFLLINLRSTTLYHNSLTSSTRPVYKPATITDYPYPSIRAANKSQQRKINRTNESEFYSNKFEFFIQPWNLCNVNKGFDLAIFVYVFSKVTSFDKRKLIRSTWANRAEFPAMHVLFVLGSSENRTVNLNVLEENEQYGDLLQGDFLDSYRNLRFKSLSAWRWLLANCTNAQQVIKMDDDVFMNTYRLTEFVAKNTILKMLEFTFVCVVFYDSLVIRDNSSKYFMSVEEYAPARYFTYCSGHVILFSPDLIPVLYEVSHESKSFWIDDLYCGFLASQIGETVAFIDLNELILPAFEYEDKKANLSSYLFVNYVEEEILYSRYMQDMKNNYFGKKRKSVPTTTTTFRLAEFGND